MASSSTSTATSTTSSTTFEQYLQHTKVWTQLQHLLVKQQPQQQQPHQPEQPEQPEQDLQVDISTLIQTVLDKYQSTLTTLVQRIFIDQDIIHSDHQATTELLTAQQVQELYTYIVPKVAAHGGCSRKKEYEPIPYMLSSLLLPSQVHSISTSTNATNATNATTTTMEEAETLIQRAIQGEHDALVIISKHAQTKRLLQLQQLIRTVGQTLNIDWLGIYHVRQVNQIPTLMKESYIGEKSRALFPLTVEFAKGSNNSTVAMTGTTQLVSDVREYQGAYYECSSSVLAELCLPIFDLRHYNLQGEVEQSSSSSLVDSTDHYRTDRGTMTRGIIDAESWTANFFTPELCIMLAKLCFDLSFVY